MILLGILISFVLQLSVGLFLWFFSKSIAKQMVAEEKAETPLTELSAKNFQSVAFSIVGLVMIAFAIPHLVQITANLQALKSAGSESLKQNVSIGTWAYSIGIAVQFILGILLFLGARGLSSLWYFFQKLRPMKDID